MTQHPGPNAEDVVLPLYAEDVAVERRTVDGDSVRLKVQTRSREYVVDENLTQTLVEIERIAIGRPVDIAPPMRVEGDTIVTVRREEAEITKEAMAPGNAATTGLTPRPLMDPDESKI
jgi:hypothetical protein